MPLNIAPLSPVRRALLNFVLLMLFVLSLGAAWGALRYKAHQQGMDRIPQGFVEVNLVPEGLRYQPDAAYQAVFDGKPRYVLIFDFPLKRKISRGQLQSESWSLFRTAVGELSLTSTKQQTLADGVFEIAGVGDEGFAVQRSGVVDQHLHVVFYRAESRETQRDLEAIASFNEALFPQ